MILDVLSELVKFAATSGDDIAEIVSSFVKARPDLVNAPPAAAKGDIDDEIDEMIDKGEL